MAIQTLGLVQPEKRSNPLENPSIPLGAGADWILLGGGNESESGELINDATAMQISTVFTCIRILSESVASLPIRLFTQTAQGKIQEVASPLYHLLAVSPNEEMSAFTWVETMMVHLALTGNSYSEIQRSASGEPSALWPLSPRQTTPVRLPNGILAYKTSDGMVGSQTRILAAKDVLHIPLCSFDGILGMSPIMQAKRSLGLAVASEKFASRLFSNYAMPQLALTTKKTVKPEDKTKMRQHWEELQSGINQHRVAILDQELSLEKLSLTSEECQFLQTRQYTRADIAAIWRIPSHYVGSEVKQTSSNVEAMGITFVVDCLRAYLSRIEAEITRKLLSREPGKAGVLSVGFDVSERLRGDTTAQAAMATAGRAGGWLTGNDIRRAQGLNEAGPELDVYLYPLNSANAENLLIAPKIGETEVNEKV